jgi:hypothetical protein
VFNAILPNFSKKLKKLARRSFYASPAWVKCNYRCGQNDPENDAKITSKMKPKTAPKNQKSKIPRNISKSAQPP